MFKLNRKLEYALLALRHIESSPKGHLTSAKEICDSYNTPFDPTSRVLQILTQNRILKAEQGVNGGYQLLKDLRSVKFSELAKIIVGPVCLTKCLSTKKLSRCSSQNTCTINGALSYLNKKINDLFDDIDIGTLIGSHTSNRIIKRT